MFTTHLLEILKVRQEDLDELLAALKVAVLCDCRVREKRLLSSLLLELLSGHWCDRLRTYGCHVLLLVDFDAHCHVNIAAILK